MSNSKRIIVLGPPSTNKSEIARRLAKRLNIEEVFVTRELLENAAQDGATYCASEVVLATIKSGSLVGNDIVSDIVYRKIYSVKSKPWVLSGAPATLAQLQRFQGLEQIGGRSVLFLNLAGFDYETLWKCFCKQNTKRDAEVFERQRLTYMRHRRKVIEGVSSHPNWELINLQVSPGMDIDELVEKSFDALGLQATLS